MEREAELLELVMSVNAPPGATVDVDMSEVSFVDSRGLRGILHARTFSRAGSVSYDCSTRHASCSTSSNWPVSPKPSPSSVTPAVIGKSE